MKPTTEEIVEALRECGNGNDATCEACPVECTGSPGCQQSLMLAAADRLEELSRWIPVMERLPEPFSNVLVYMPSEHPFPTVREACYVPVSKPWYVLRRQYDANKVTHWMPLPERPREVE